MARIGIFGGSFNPPHLGHMLAVQEFLEKLALDRVLLIPAGTPPHKHLTENSPSPGERLELCRLAVQSLPCVQVLDLELCREGKSFTADTVEILHAQYPDDTLFLLMGTDMFLSFADWYQPERITAHCRLAVAHRETDDPAQRLACAEALKARFGAETVFVENRFLPHSSTSVRAMLAFGAGESYVAPAVLEYIRANRLYYCGMSLKKLAYDALSAVSLSLHRTSRMPHVQGCSQMARTLAERYGADPDAAARAGILHDITKALNAEEQLKLCETYGMILDDFEARNPKLLHAKTGAAVAERVFGETPQVCEAIRWHTTGKANMNTLEKIIYLADYMEPNRSFDGVEALRAAVFRSLDEGLQTGLGMTMRQLVQQGREIAPSSLAAFQFLEGMKNL